MKIKILFYIDTLIGGGAEKVLRNLVNSMDYNKFEITVQTTFKEDVSDYLNKEINYRYCYKTQNSISRLIFRAEAATGLVYPLHIKDDYDIEVAYLEAASTKIMAGSTNKKAKKLAWVHCNLEKNTDDVSEYVAKTKLWYQKFDKVICVSKNVHYSFSELFGSTPPSEVIYNTVDDNEIIQKAICDLPAGIKKEKLTLLAVGRLSTPKNYPRLLKSVKTLLNEGFDFELWILGEGNLRHEIENLIKEYAIQDHVKLLGFYDNPYPFIKTADLSVCSSDYEGLSTFVTESLILGKVVVTTDCGGMDELLGENEYGIITENNDEAFTEGLRKILSNPQLLDEYTKKAQTRGQQFSKEKLTAQTENLFFDTLGI
ncbi:MAG: glycosyltransferase [Ruminococcaceae bacterium]|nr:glycosyltransferase [Oscillospiraceae bacterium]